MSHPHGCQKMHKNTEMSANSAYKVISDKTPGPVCTLHRWNLAINWTWQFYRLNRSCDSGWTIFQPYFSPTSCVCVCVVQDRMIMMWLWYDQVWCTLMKSICTKHGNRLIKKTTQGLIELLPTSRAMEPILSPVLKLIELIQKLWSPTSSPTSPDTRRAVWAKGGSLGTGSGIVALAHFWVLHLRSCIVLSV